MCIRDSKNSFVVRRNCLHIIFSFLRIYSIYLHLIRISIFKDEYENVKSMKLKILTMMLCVALLSACTKQAESEAPQIDYKAQFEESDRKIGEFLDQLDNPNTPQEVKVKILCHDYPDVYKKQYMPALIKVSPKPYTEEKLLSDLKSATDYYKGTLGIKCNE